MAKNYNTRENFKQFMIALKEWIDAGCQDPTEEQLENAKGFRKEDSICFQIARWAIDDVIEYELEEDLNHLLKDDFGQTAFPFNFQDSYFGSDEYKQEMENGSHYEKKERVEWINKIVKSFKKEHHDEI